jgi:transcriptional regulator with PAS, ATPase and Fis domain
MESELFDRFRGAFTNAVKDRKGRFELAEGGTLFLDEVSEIGLHLQAKLLRVIQEREYHRVGETGARKADVRIISATNKRLKDLMTKGVFRDDLYYRLNVVSVTPPPLRERKEDIPIRVEPDRSGRPAGSKPGNPVATDEATRQRGLTGTFQRLQSAG